MHWLPLVAMVIASALPFPHKPVSRIAAATTEPGFDNRRAHRHAAAARLAAPPVDYGFQGNGSQPDYHVATAAAAARSQRGGGGTGGGRHNLQKRRGHSKPSEALEDGGSYSSNSNSGSDGVDAAAAGGGGGALRTEEISQDAALPKDYSRRDYSGFNKEVQDSTSPRPGPTEAAGLSEDGLNLDAALDEMFLDAHPRVLFSPSPSPPKHPPLLLMLETGLLEEEREEEREEDQDGHIEGHGDRALSWADAPAARAKRSSRSSLSERRRGEKSVCESVNVWVTDKKTAIDSHGVLVTILQEIQTQTGPLKQYFFETRCREAEQFANASAQRPGAAVGTGVAGAGCLGVDKKQWVSECKAKQSYVRALTKDANNRTGWRWIRIDSSCVCVLLSRTNQASTAKEVLMRKGRS